MKKKIKGWRLREIIRHDCARDSLPKMEPDLGTSVEKKRLIARLRKGYHDSMLCRYCGRPMGRNKVAFLETCYECYVAGNGIPSPDIKFIDLVDLACSKDLIGQRLQEAHDMVHKEDL